MLIDDFMASWDAVKRHEIRVKATPAETLTAVREMDLGSDRLIGALLKMRGLRRPATGWAGLVESGFIRLGETDRELLAGIVGRFWTPGGGVRRMPPEQFVEFDEPGHAKATWNFAVEELGNGATRLTTETRILCTDRRARRRFRAYWTVVAPFSGLIRSRALRRIKAAAEAV